jgi:hypothetical protein
MMVMMAGQEESRCVLGFPMTLRCQAREETAPMNVTLGRDQSLSTTPIPPPFWPCQKATEAWSGGRHEIPALSTNLPCRV